MCCNSILKCRVSTDMGLILPRAGVEGVRWGQAGCGEEGLGRPHADLFGKSLEGNNEETD